MEARVFPSVLLLSQCDLCLYYTPAAPAFRFLRFIYWLFLLSPQGLFGGGALGVPSRRRGEREHHHFWSQGGDACPGAAVGEGADGHPRPRLGAR